MGDDGGGGCEGYYCLNDFKLGDCDFRYVCYN